MAICEMSSFSMIGLLSEKDKALNVLSKTCSVQIKKTKDLELTSGYSEDASFDYTLQKDRARRALNFLNKTIDEVPSSKRGVTVKDGFSVSIDEFLNFDNRVKAVESKIEEIERLENERREISERLTKLKEELSSYLPYENLSGKFSDYLSGKYYRTYLGTVAVDKTAEFLETVKKIPLAVVELVSDCGTCNAVAVVVYRDNSTAVESELSRYSFNQCPFKDSVYAKDEIERINGEAEQVKKRDNELIDGVLALSDYIKELKIYIDYISFLEEKVNYGKDFKYTTQTFILEGYVPTYKTQEVEKAVKDNLSAVFTEFEVIDRKDFAPTLMQNGKRTGNFEAVTNMYSVPAYGAFDPNGVMSFFFSLFMGFIMGDFGYGLLMIIGGFLFSKKQREGSGIARLANVFAYGGFFALFFGALFDSWFGFPLLRTVLGSSYNVFYSQHIDAINAKVSVTGISIPSMLMWSLGLGTCQIAVSLILKALQCFKRKQIVEGIFGGLLWSFALFSGIAFAVITIEQIDGVKNIITIITVILFALAILTSGLWEKGLKKITSVFGSLYGIINYVSDILSYARLYGLMLSGAQIASIFTNTLAIEMLFPSGFIGVVFGIVIIIVGNIFNLAMSLLGAFIHDSRLQYVEFFGRFYEGEGELFTPIGTVREFIYLK